MAVNGLCTSTEDFLKRCEQSGDAASSMLHSLLERLEDPVTRKEARIFLTLLHKRSATTKEVLAMESQADALNQLTSDELEGKKGDLPLVERQLQVQDSEIEKELNELRRRANDL